MTKSKEDLKSDAEINVNKSGFPLELAIHSLLTDRGYTVRANDYFFDPDGKTARSIDLAVKEMEGIARAAKGDFAPLYAEMDIECKRSENDAWIFFTVPSEIRSREAGQFLDAYQAITTEFDSGCLAWMFSKDLSLHYGKEKTMSSIATGYTTVKKGSQDPKENEGKDDIFKALNQVLKYIGYQSDLDNKHLNEVNPKSKRYPFVRAYFPIVVFDGLMYSGEMHGDKVELSEVDHIVLQHRYRPPYMDRERFYYVDIVKKERFATFLANVEEDCRLLYSVMVDRFQDILDLIYTQYSAEMNAKYDKSKFEDFS